MLQDNKDKLVGALVAIPIGIGINLATDILPSWISILLFCLSLLSVVAYLASSRILQWRRSKTALEKQKQISALRVEVDKFEKIVGDQRLLVSNLAQLIISVIIISTYFTMALITAIEITPFLQNTVDNNTARIATPVFYFISIVVCFVLLIFALGKDIQKITNFDKFKDESITKIERMTQEMLKDTSKSLSILESHGSKNQQDETPDKLNQK